MQEARAADGTTTGSDRTGSLPVATPPTLRDALLPLMAAGSSSVSALSHGVQLLSSHKRGRTDPAFSRELVSQLWDTNRAAAAHLFVLSTCVGSQAPWARDECAQICEMLRPSGAPHPPRSAPPSAVTTAIKRVKKRRKDGTTGAGAPKPGAGGPEIASAVLTRAAEGTQMVAGGDHDGDCAGDAATQAEAEAARAAASCEMAINKRRSKRGGKRKRGKKVARPGDGGEDGVVGGGGGGDGGDGAGGAGGGGGGGNDDDGGGGGSGGEDSAPNEEGACA
eukprot:scaffold33939_cov112-Isochrysis_galbana.AAC.3